jgi:hypothetical protein
MASDYSLVEDRTFDEKPGSKDPGFSRLCALRFHFPAAGRTVAPVRGHVSREGAGMAIANCGKSQVIYDEKKCIFKCNQISATHHGWIVTCGTGKDAITVSGTDREQPPPPRRPGGTPAGDITVSGSLVVLAATLAQEWGRRVTVPRALKGKILRQRKLQGSPEDMAKALGLILGPAKRSRARSR